MLASRPRRLRLNAGTHRRPSGATAAPGAGPHCRSGHRRRRQAHPHRFRPACRPPRGQRRRQGRRSRAVSGRAHDARIDRKRRRRRTQGGRVPDGGIHQRSARQAHVLRRPEKCDSQADALDLKLAEVVDVIISSATAPPKTCSKAPTRSAWPRGKANESAARKQRKGVRNVEVGNNLYPTPWRAQRYGMSEEELSKLFWAA